MTDHDKLMQTDVCALAAKTNANVAIRSKGKAVFLSLEYLLAVEEKLGKGNITMELCVSFCEEAGEPAEYNNNVQFSLVSRDTSKEEALKFD